MVSVQQALHKSSPVRIGPLIAILVLHILLFLVLSRSNVLQTDKDIPGTAVAFLVPATTPANPLIQKTEYERPVHQKLALASQKKSVRSPKAIASPASIEKLPAPVAIAKSITDISAGVEADAPNKTTINLAQLRSQVASLARELSQSDATESGNTGILGNYYGSYNGADTGTFYIHVDHIGNIFGSADSSTAHSSFTITGKVSTNGVVQMTGKGLAGSASFDGKINLKTGGVSGHWNLTGFGKGQFAGQRAKAGGGRAY
ncbi:hypothetical protein [Undibacterium sp. Ji49W]|uniref:hypothetical protein n=1 Tax=Undibacterium sp. Ji49W TaxID=3413040 RepID=UPI003BEF4D13